MRNKKGKKRSHTVQEYWQSYSDMMAALLFMFILIMAITLYQSLNTFEQKNKELEEQKQTIAEQSDRLKIQESEAEEQKKLLEQRESEAEEQRKLLEQQESEAEVQRELLKQQKSELTTKEDSLNKTTAQLEELSRLVGVKAEIIESLSEEFEQSELHVKVDKSSGAITFDSSVVFDTNSYTLTDAGKQFLQVFIPKYISVLLQKTYKDYISEIIIEGHTDTKGDYIYNLDLSQQRANVVAAYCLDEQTSPLEMKQIEVLRTLVTANGRSFSDPILKRNGEVDMDASRRVVFKFRVKDEEMIEEMQRILEGVDD